MNQEIILILFQVLVLVLAFSVHESAHAYVAMRLGDPTAYMLGRVTLNPIRHLDPLGSVLVPLISLVYGGWLIGWAKPCPVTLRNFKNIRRDDILTSLAGPASNLAMALIALIMLIVFKHLVPGGAPAIGAAQYLATGGSGIDTAHQPILFPFALLFYFMVLINLSLFIFNLIPIPPLDGSHVLRNFLSPRLEAIYNQVGRFGLILMFLVGGRLIMPYFYYPLLNVFDGVLAVL